MKFLSMIQALGRALFEPAETAAEGQDWWRDPLFHPALAAMSPRELADLPFNRRYRLPPETLKGLAHLH